MIELLKTEILIRYETIPINEVVNHIKKKSHHIIRKQTQAIFLLQKKT